jgi:alpha-L-rhamnosidase
MKRLAALCLAGLLAARAAALTPADLRCDYAADPLGVDAATPRLFWKLESRRPGQHQTAYQILAASSAQALAHDRGDLWDSGRVASDESVQIPYAGAALKSSQAVFWKVRVWDAAGRASAWSRPATWTMGILAAGDWHAQWIGTPDTNTANLLLRREFSVRPGLRRALVHICGLGQYVLSFNGRRAGDAFLSPGWTKYDRTCLYDTLDVTALLRRGPNAAGIALGNGMYNVVPGGRFAKFKGSFGPQQAIAQLRLEYADGTVETVGTDASWRAADGPVTFDSIYGGEDFDARRMLRGWDAAPFDDSSWAPATVMAGPGGALRGLSAAAPPLRQFEIHRPVSARVLTNGDVVYDLGQNAAHVPRLRVTGPAGSRVRLIPAELVHPDGAADQQSMGAGRRGTVWCEFTKGTDGPETWAPEFFYIGCRYVQVQLAPAVTNGARPKIKSLEGVVVHSAAAPAGEFECSNPLFNRIRTLVCWAQRANTQSVLTDCPHRERLGWLEQYHLNGPALRYETDLDALYTKAMNDMADSQRADGLVPTTAPEYTSFKGAFLDSPEWGSAAVIVPWQQYAFAADREMLRRNFDAMRRYVDYLGTRATNHIVSHGLGDWYDVGPNKPGISQLTPIALSATAFYYGDARILADTAALLGRTDEAQAYAGLADGIRAAFNAQFYDAARQTYATGSQYANAVALALGLCEATNRAAVLDALVRDVRAHGNALTTGDVGYRYLLRALADGGRSDVIYDINNQSDKPGYGYQLRQGATSLTEAWDARRGASQDHFMLGQIDEWFFHDVAGIGGDPAGPGFKRIIIRPQPAGDLAWARAAYESIRGRIACEWRRAGGKFTLRVTIPANTTATVYVPAREGTGVRAPAGARGLGWQAGRAVYAVDSGRHEFVSEY